MKFLKIRNCTSGFVGHPMLSPSFLVVHRCDLETKAPGNDSPILCADLDGLKVVEAFKNKLLGTGGARPYHFWINVDGSIDQLIPLNYRGAHAIGYNHNSWAIAVCGDFRDRSQVPTSEMHAGHPYRQETCPEYPIDKTQCDALVLITSVLVKHASKKNRVEIKGHDQLLGATRDTKKVCPGNGIDIEQLSDCIKERSFLADEPGNYGIVFEV